MDRGGRTDGRAEVIGQGRDELTFAEFGGGRDGRADAREAEACAGATGGSKASDVALASSVLWYG